MDALSIAVYRSLIGGLAMIVLVPRKQWIFKPVMIPLCLIFGAMIAFYISAVKLTTAANAIFLQCTATFWVVPLAILFLKERPDRRSVIGIGLATIGCVAILGFGHDGSPGETRGIILGLLSGIGYAFAVIGMRSLRGLNPYWLSGVNNLGATITIYAWILLSGGTLATPTPNQTLTLAFFGIVQMSVPYALFARGLQTIGPAEAGLLGLLEPVLNPIWVYLVRGEVPHTPTFIGGAFLLMGVATKYWPTRSLQRRSDQPPP
jgi:drug/metabolite transporter (DMT)-like permease